MKNVFNFESKSIFDCAVVFLYCLYFCALNLLQSKTKLLLAEQATRVLTYLPRRSQLTDPQCDHLSIACADQDFPRSGNIGSVVVEEAQWFRKFANSVWSGSLQCVLD